MVQTEITRLAWEIASQTIIYDDYLQSNNIPTPSHKIETPATLVLPAHIQAARDAVLEASVELQTLLQGPMAAVHAQTYQASNIMYLHAIYKYKLASCVPVGGEATYEEISKISGLNLSEARRIIRFAMTKHIFTEPRDGVVAHTATSKLLAVNPVIHQWIGMVCEELWPAGTRTVEALIKWPGSEERNQTGFSLLNETEDDPFTLLSQFPERAQRFAAALSLFNSHPGQEQIHLINAFEWQDIETFVDIGGSLGASAVTVAQHFPYVKCIVQDRPEVAARTRASIPEPLTDRVTFMTHDFIAEQPVKDADIYHFRRVFHNWSDKYCVKILQALIPALKQGARVIIADLIIPQRGSISLYKEWQIRNFDLGMMQLFNSKEREEPEWAALVKAADERFSLLSIRQPKGSSLAFVEVGWNIASKFETHESVEN